MSKKQFTLDSWLKDKSQKVVTRCGFPVRIVCTDVKRKDYPILALVERDDQEEYQSFTKDGRFSLYNPLHDNFDLFIETADEVSEDEMVRKALIDFFGKGAKYGSQTNGVYDKDILAWLEKQAEQNFEMKTAEESLGIDSDTYNKIVDECLFGEQKLTEFERGLFDMLTDISKPCTADCVKSHSEKLLSIARKMIALEQKPAEKTKPQSSTPMSYGKELEKRMCEACNRFFAPNTDSNRYSASDLFYAGVKAERDLNTLAWSEEDEPQKELAASYLTKFDEKFPILPTLKGKQLADYKNFLNKCQQIFGLRYWGFRPLQAKLFEKLSLLWAAWGAEHLQGLGQTDGDMDNEISMWSEEDECYMSECIGAIATKDGWSFDEKRKTKHWLKSLKDRVLLQPKQKWSEDDDNDTWMNDIISKVENNLQLNKAEIDWLKFIKDQVQPKQEWSEEDSFRTETLISVIKSGGSIRPELRNEFVNWLKSLRPQNHWKPSDEQMEALDWQVENTSVSSWQYKATKELMEDLKKLKGEV